MSRTRNIYTYKEPKINMNKIFPTLCVLMFLAFAVWAIHGIVTYEKPTVGTNFKTESTWSNPVVDIKSCHSGKYSYSCLVLVEGEPQYIRRDFRYWPGNTIQKGDKLGYHYRIGEKYVEKWRTRSSSNMMSYVHICKKTDKECTWPSKNAPITP